MRKRWGEGGRREREHETGKEGRGKEKKSTKKQKEGHSREAVTEN